MSEYGILVVSHSTDIAQGIKKLLTEVAKDISISAVGGTEDEEIGTSFDLISQELSNNDKDKVLAFFDIGSAKMNLDMAIEMSDKVVTLYEVPIVEGAYTAAALLQADADIEAVQEQLKELRINK